MSDSPTPAKSAPTPAAWLGRRLQRLLAPLRVRRLSLHDGTGSVIWVSAGEFGRTQQRQLQEAMDAFALDAGLEHLERDLAEGARGHFFSVRTAAGERGGIAFAVVSTRRRPDINPAALVERVLASMRRFSDDLPGGLPAVCNPSAASERPVARRLHEPEAGSLRSRPYIRLRPGGTTRRYEIIEADQGTVEQDLRSAARLLRLLQRRDARDTRAGRAPATFVLPLCAASVLTPDFLVRLSASLQQADIAADMLGFGIPAAAWQADPAATERFMKQCAELGCFVALEDFSLDGPGFGLLRSGVVRCLKLDAQLVSNALTDKFAHASVVAIVKAARVFGLFCVAKGVKRTATAQWLAANGVEFAERPNRRATSGATTRGARALRVAGAG